MPSPYTFNNLTLIDIVEETVPKYTKNLNFQSLDIINDAITNYTRNLNLQNLEMAESFVWDRGTKASQTGNGGFIMNEGIITEQELHPNLAKEMKSLHGKEIENIAMNDNTILVFNKDKDKWIPKIVSDAGSSGGGTSPGTVVIGGGHRWGIKWNKTDDIVTRLGDAAAYPKIGGADGVNPNDSIANPFNVISPWKDIVRVNLSDDGKENAINDLLHNIVDATYKDDGTNGQVMTRIPKFYYKIVPEYISTELSKTLTITGGGCSGNKVTIQCSTPIKKDGVIKYCWWDDSDGSKGNGIISIDYDKGIVVANCTQYADQKWTLTYESANKFMEFWISDTLNEGYELHPAFYRDVNADGYAEEVDKRYIGAYEGTVILLDGSYSLTSTISGNTPSVSKNLNSFRDIANNRNSSNSKRWGIQDFNLTYAIQLLYLIEYANFNSQDRVGMGIVNGSILNTGTTANMGNKTGNKGNDGKNAMTYRGIENLWGNVYKFVDGMVRTTSGYLVGNCSFNDSGSGYESIPQSTLFASSSSYITDIYQNKKLGFIPSAGSGSSSSKLCDQSAYDGGSILVFGGSAGVNTAAGIFCQPIFVNKAYSDVCSRLAY